MNGLNTKRDDERGAMLLLITVIVLPLLFLGFTLSVDLKTFYVEANAVQKVLDEAALQGYRSLPFREEARNVVDRFLAVHAPRHFSSLDNLSIGTTGDSITLSFNGPHELFFPKILFTITGHGEASTSLPLNTLTKVRGTPFDTLIAFDASGTYLAPPVESAVAWGDPTLWPIADFFQTHAVYRPTGPVEKRVASAQCFNEAFSPLKLGAVRAYEYFSAFDLDQVGVGVYPSGNRELELLRKVKRRVAPGATPSGSLGEADFLGVNGIARQDTFCAAAAENEVNTDRYRFPVKNSKLTHWVPAGAAPPVSMVLHPSYTPNPDYRDYQEVRQSIWATAVRDGAPASFDTVFHEALRALLEAPALPERGTLQARPAKTLWFFAGDVPWVGGVRYGANNGVDLQLRAKLAQYRDNIAANFQDQDFELSVYYILFNHIGQNSLATATQSALETTFSSFLIPDSKKIRVHVLALHSATALERQLLPLLLLNQRAAFIEG